MKPKLVYDNEWIRGNNFNQHFDIDVICSVCRRASCGPKWYNIRTKETRCTKCFTPKQYGGLEL